METVVAFWLMLAVKMAATGAFVVLATRAAERAGPLIGAMVATLPVSAGPAYVFIALDHGADFIAASAVASLATNAATIVFCATHALVAQRRGTAVSLAAAFGTWAVLAVAIRSTAWTLPAAALLNLGVVVVCLPLGRKLRDAPMPPLLRRWYDVPLRAGLVAVLVATVVALSSYVGPTVTGILALVPVVLTSVILIFQPRIGGPATAAITANSIVGMAGFAMALAVLQTTVMALGSALALGLALAVAVAWNFSVFLIRRRIAVVISCCRRGRAR